MGLRRNILFALIILVSFATSSLAYKVEYLEFSDVFRRGSADLAIQGAGLKRFLTIDVVGVALYLPQGTLPEDALKDIPKRLEVIYLQNIPKEELRRATTKGILRNVGKTEFKAMKPRIDELNALYPDVKKGDKIQMTYVPGAGLEMAVNGIPKGVIKGKDFARAFYAIWVGENPVDERMKLLLLGERKQPPSP